MLTRYLANFIYFFLVDEVIVSRNMSYTFKSVVLFLKKAHFLSFCICTSTNFVTYVYKTTKLTLNNISCQNCDRNRKQNKFTKGVVMW